MIKFLRLCKTLLKTSGNITSSNKKYQSILIGAVLIMSFAPIAYGIGQLVSVLHDTFSVIGQEGLLLGFAFSGISIIVLFFGIFAVLAVFYFSTDTETLLYMPLKPETILASKFISVLVYEYIIEAVVLLPVFIGYGIKANISLTYYIYGALILLTLPIIPLVIASIIIMVVMSFSDFMKDKEKFRMISGFLTIFIAIGINVVIQRTLGNNFTPEAFQEMLLEGNNSLINVITGLFPSTKFSAQAIVNNDLSQMLIYILINILAFSVFLLTGKKLYFKGVLGISEASSKRKELKSKEFNKSTTQSHKIKTYAIKELRVLFRTTAFLINCISVNFIWIFILFLPFLSSQNEMNALKEVLEIAKLKEYQGFLIGLIFAFSIFSNAANNIGVTGVTREGKDFFINNYIPITYKEIVISKLIPGIIMGLINLVLLIFIEFILLKPSITIIILTIPISLLALIFVNLIGLLIDIYNPRLNWDNEYKAVKQNVNVIINLLLNIAIAGIVGFLAFKFKLSLNFTAISIFTIFILANILLYKIITNYGEKFFKKISA